MLTALLLTAAFSGPTPDGSALERRAATTSPRVTGYDFSHDTSQDPRLPSGPPPAWLQCEERESRTARTAAYLIGQCQAAVEEAQESRRLIRNTLVTFGANTMAHAFDLAATEWAESRYACRDAPGAVLCTYESNVFTPTSMGRFAWKAVIVFGVTGFSYLADRLGHPRWATVIRWLGVAGGVIPAAVNVHQGLTVEKSRAPVGSYRAGGSGGRFPPAPCPSEGCW